MLEKIAKSRRKCLRLKKPENGQKQSKMRESEKYVQKNMFCSIFFILLIYRGLGKNRQKSRKKL